MGGSANLAMTAIGYGVQNGEKYWLIQNSWGHGWAWNGMIKIKRGVNLGHIEEKAVYFRGWVEGASIPPVPECVDATSFRGFTRDYSCKELNQWECHGRGVASWEVVNRNCPVLCNRCKLWDQPVPTPAPVTCYCTSYKNQYRCSNDNEATGWFTGYCSEWQA